MQTMMATNRLIKARTSAVPRPMTKTWSASRDQVLQHCEHKYFFQYLAGAKLGGDDPFLRELALLKKVKTALMWQGDLFHWAVALCCETRRGGRPISRAKLFERLEQKIDEQWKFSETGSYRTHPYDIEKRGVALFEHVYGESSDLVDPGVIFERLKVHLQKFFAWAGGEVDLPSRVAEAANAWIEPQAFGPEAPGFQEGDVQVLAKVDLALQETDGRFEIFDWKTGKAPEQAAFSVRHNDFQVNIYQLWPFLQMKLPIETISSRLVYFGGPEAVELRFALDEESISITRGFVQDSIALAERWRLDVEEGRMTLDDLDYAQSEWICRQCAFKKICRERLHLSN
jgi:hypothetical protein